MSACSSEVGAEVEDQSTNPWLSGLALTQPSDANEFGHFFDVSADGKVVVVGDPYAGSARHGAVTVYRKDGDIWTSKNLPLPALFEAQSFGASVAISDDGKRIVVGDLLADAAFVYQASGDVWTPTHLERPDGFEEFGLEVAISGDGNVVGVSDAGRTDHRGAHVYLPQGGSWAYATSVPYGLDEDVSSIAFSFDGSTMVTGDRNEVKVYQRVGAILQNPTVVETGIAPDGFRVDLSADGNTVVSSLVSRQLAYVTVAVRTGDEWSSPSSLPPPSGSSNFGTSIALSSDGNTLAVGDPLGLSGRTSNRGSVTLYNRTGSIWSVGRNLPPPASGAFFGLNVAISGDGKTLLANTDPNADQNLQDGFSVLVHARR